jgi:tetratricopeptide (TPR) repeat protein
MRGGKESESSEVATVVELAVPTVQLSGTTTADDADDGSGAASQIRRGDCVGRYIIIEQLGIGGMGVVFSAYDPELDRCIALKLVHVKFVSSEQRARLQARLLREAQALAKLSHPNVIAVHDVGTFHDDVFVAMELVEGRTLGEVLRDDKPSNARALRLFVAAGRGLAAAHAAGLVHRDFKPDNVAVAADGRVCVLDFGLARAAHDGSAAAEAGGEPAPRPSLQATHDDNATSEPRVERTPRGSVRLSVASRLSSERRLLGTSLTAFGTVLGTPHYMAPEQLLGKDVDARADQFSFCVGLYRALFHKKPFARTTYADGEPAAPPPSVGTSARLRRAIMKGLELDPARRHASMDALLAELTASPSRTAWWIGGGAVALAGVAALTTLRQVPPGQPALCQGAPRKLAGVWEPAIGERIKATFVAVKGAPGGPAADRVVQALDGYTQRWVAMHTEACEATQVRGEQSPHVMDLRMQCLQRDLDRVSALAQMFASDADAALVDRATQAARGLPPIDACADLAALTAAVAPPTDRRVADQVTSLRATLSKIEAMQYAGRYKQAAAAASKAVAETDAVPYEPVQAEALYLEGKLFRLAGEDKDAAEATVRKALRTAGQARDHVLVAKSASELLVAVGLTSGRADEAASLIDLATAAVGQAGNSDELRGQLLNNIGVVHMLQENVPQARQDWEDGLAVWQRALGPDHPDVLKTVINLGSAYSRLGKQLEAIKYQKRVIKTQQETLGPDHPALAISLHNLGVCQGLAGYHDDEIASIQKALKIDEAALGPEDPNVARDLGGVATGLKALKRPAEALPLELRAVAINEKALGLAHPDTTLRLFNLSETFIALGRYDEALATLHRALAGEVKIHGPADFHIVYAHVDLAKFFVGRKRLREAAAEAERAKQIAEKSAPTALANALAALADVRRAERRPAEAAQLLVRAVAADVKSPPADKTDASGHLCSLVEVYGEAGKLDLATATYARALALWDKDTEADGERGLIRFSLAKAIAAKDRTRATGLATTARQELASPQYADQRAELEKWLAGR